jgi:arginine/lysine/ornithine decarboxylase
MRSKVFALVIILYLNVCWAFFTKSLVTGRIRTWQSTRQDRTPFVEALVRAQPALTHRFFFPGHAGSASNQENLNDIFGESLHKYDLPELDELDNLHHPEGPLLEAQQLAAELFGASRTWFLVNGSTSGVLIALLSCIRLHQQRAFPSTQRSVVLLPRDSHKAAFNALTLAQNCDAVLLPCEQDSTFQVSLGVTLETVRRALEEYDGRVSYPYKHSHYPLCVGMRG